jgi:mannose-1-phosphate guanylyltransferase
MVVTNERLVGAVTRELPKVPRTAILGEPVGRNTAPCIGWAALELLHRDPEAVMAVLPADHVIADGDRFRADLAAAFALAETGEHLVTFGIPPTEPATGYGYIRAGKALGQHPTARAVAGFVEKPTLPVARRYVASGKYFWNSGMFVWKAARIWAELTEHLPELAAGLEAMERKRKGGRIRATDLARAFPALQSVSIDYGVLERSRRVAMIPATFPWSDIGSWDAAADLWPADAHGNASRDPLLAIDSRGNVVASRGKPVALLGVSDLVVVDAGDALLVCPRSRCQDVRQVVAAIGGATARDRKLRELL